jgi:hypothetical protein
MLGDVFMKDKKDHRQTKAIGSQVNVKIWNELRVQALMEGRKTGEVLDDCIRMYLESKKGDFGEQELRFPLE